MLVNYEGQEHNLDFFVVKKDSPSLFGRAWLKQIKLDWNSIKFCKQESQQKIMSRNYYKSTIKFSQLNQEKSNA